MSGFDLDNCDLPLDILEMCLSFNGWQLSVDHVYFGTFPSFFNERSYRRLLQCRQHPNWSLLFAQGGVAGDARDFLEGRVGGLLSRLWEFAQNRLGGTDESLNHEAACLTLFLLPNLVELRIDAKVLEALPSWDEVQYAFSNFATNRDSYVPTSIATIHADLFANLTHLFINGKAVPLSEAAHLIMLPNIKELTASLVSHRKGEEPTAPISSQYPREARSGLEKLYCTASAVTPLALTDFLLPCLSLRIFCLEYSLQEDDKSEAYVEHDTLDPIWMLQAVGYHLHLRSQLQYLQFYLNPKRVENLRTAMIPHLIGSFRHFIGLSELHVDYELYEGFWPNVHARTLVNIYVNPDLELEAAMEEVLKNQGILFY